MQNTDQTITMYSEQEAADLLEISLFRLYNLLDEHVFNDGTARPADLTFTSSELVLLGFWHRLEPNPKVLRMPRRY
jgi:prophage maintenance system killer protein